MAAPVSAAPGGICSGCATGNGGQSATNGQVMSTYTVTAGEVHLCGERGSPVVGKGAACLRGGYAPQSGGKYGNAIFGG